MLGAMGKNIFSLFFRDKPAKVLILLLGQAEATYASKLAKGADCTYPHIVKILAEFKAAGLVRVSSKGRVKPLSLTPKGARLAARLRELQLLCEQN